MGQKILVADNDFQTVQSIKEAFTKEKEVAVISSDSADIAIEIAWKQKPHVIIVNKNLPDLSGWEVLGILKKNEPTRLIPFIMLSDKIDYKVDDEVRALDLGAEDYINKPFDSGIFWARTKAILRRFLSYKRELEVEEILKSGNILLNMTTHIPYVNEKPLDLTPKEFALLYIFIKKKKQVLSRNFLSGTIWEHEYFHTSRTIDKHIANLRKKLGPEGERIETIPTIGYKFTEEE